MIHVLFFFSYIVGPLSLLLFKNLLGTGLVEVPAVCRTGCFFWSNGIPFYSGDVEVRRILVGGGAAFSPLMFGPSDPCLVCRNRPQGVIFHFSCRSNKGCFLLLAFFAHFFVCQTFCVWWFRTRTALIFFGHSLVFSIFWLAQSPVRFVGAFSPTLSMFPKSSFYLSVSLC